MGTLITQGFHHIAFVSGHAERTVGFYRDLLGLQVVSQSADPVTAAVRALTFGDATALPGSLVQFTVEPNGGRGRFGVGGVHHLAFGTATPETQLMWKRRLMEAGVPVSGPLNRGYFVSIYFRDPDGQVLEIATAGPGYDYDEPIDQLGVGIMSHDPARLPGGRDEAAIHAMTYPEPVPTVRPEMALAGIHHISGMTDDVIRANEFYHEALGIRLIKKTINQDDPDTPHWFWANYDGTRILPHSSWTLFGWNPQSPHARPGVGQTAHVAFRAKDADELNAWNDHLQSIGLSVAASNDRLRFTAPDGQPLELVVG
jgi:glyoxalase family protein